MYEQFYTQKFDNLWDVPIPWKTQIIKTHTKRAKSFE